MARGQHRHSTSCSENFYAARARQRHGNNEELIPPSRKRSLPTVLSSSRDDDGDNSDLEMNPGEDDQGFAQTTANNPPPNLSRVEPGVSSQTGSFGSLPVEIFDIILDFLLPADQTIVLMPLCREKKSLATTLMAIRLSSKSMQELVLDYWHSTRVRRGLTDNSHLGLVNPTRTT